MVSGCYYILVAPYLNSDHKGIVISEPGCSCVEGLMTRVSSHVENSVDVFCDLFVYFC